MSALPSAPRPSRTASRTAVVAAAVLLSGGLAACGEDPVDSRPAAAATPAAPTAALSPTAAPKPTVAALTADPLTGGPQVPTGSVVAVKIDNSPLARPFHRGLDSASIIYQELMEGGSTRFLAVYAPAVAAEVGPVRSIREGDLELIQQYGTIALAGSGGNKGVLASFAQAAAQGRVLDANFEVVPGPYRKGEKRRDAYNFFTTPQKIDQARPGGAQVKDIGLRFGPLTPGAGFPANRASVRFSPLAKVTAQYDPATGRYAVFQDGDRMKDYAPANVVVQHAQIKNTRYVDVLGNPTPYTATVGNGPAVVLRDGRRLSGTWRRLTGDFGTRFFDDKMRDIPLKPGPTLVLLVPSGARLDVG